MHTTLLGQATAEYGVMTARHATSGSWEGLQRVLDGAQAYVTSHPFAVGLGAIVLFALYRFVFSAPRLR